MTSFFQTGPVGEADAAPATPVPVNPWMVVLGSLAGVLLLGGVITAGVGLGVVGSFGGTVLGQDQTFDEGVATAVAGGAAILVGVLVGTAWLVLGVIRFDRER